MAFIHTEFMLPVYVAEAGESPKPGAFFATAKGSNLSKIAKAAYNDSSAWKVINSNAWNMANCVYRADSTNCGSEKRESSWAKNTVSPNASAKSAFIALCTKDTKQVPTLPYTVFTYPVIWIPDLAKMPMPVKPSPKEEPQTDPEVMPTFQPVDRDPVVGPVVTPTTPKKKFFGGGGGGNGGSSDVTPTTPAQEAGMSPWLLVGLGVVAVIGVIMWPTTKSKVSK